METPPPCRLNIDGIFTDAERILTANYTRFIRLSFFFLPLCFHLISTPIFHLLSQLLTTANFHKFPQIQLILDQNHHNSVVCYIFCFLIVYLLAMCAISSITYTTQYSFSGKPVNFLNAVKSIKSTFVPIVTTAITAHSLIFLFSLSFLLFVRTNLMLVHNLGFVIDYNSSNSIWFSYIISAVLIAIVTFLLTNWSLAFAVVVVESKSGLSALRRSVCLVKGMRSVSLILCLYFGFLIGILVWVLSDAIHALRGTIYVWFVFIIGSGFLMSYMRHYIVATTILYNYCKVFHGELEIDGFGHDYVDLGFDEEKVKVFVMSEVDDYDL